MKYYLVSKSKNGGLALTVFEAKNTRDALLYIVDARSKHSKGDDYRECRGKSMKEIREHLAKMNTSGRVADLAIFAVVELVGRAGREDADGGGQQRIAYRQALEVSVAAAGCRRGDLAHAVALRKRKAAAAAFEEAVELCLKTGVHRIAAGTGSTEEAEVKSVCHLPAVHELFIVRRDEQRVLGAVFLDVVADLIGVELRDNDDLKSEREWHVQARYYAVGREHRDDVQKALAALIGNAAVHEVKRDGVKAVV